MRKLFTTLTSLLFIAFAWAQSPEKMSYQAVIRDAGNQLVVNREIGMRISILHGSDDGNAVYVESLNPTTNANGLVSLEIGNGVGFSDIDWSDGSYFIKTETDPSGGTNYTITGISQLLSVPFALYAKAAATVTGEIVIDEADPVFSSSPASGIETVDIGNWNAAYGWGDHSAEGYLTTESDPALAENFDFTGSQQGDLLIFNGEKWVKFTPDYLSEFIESDPTWEGPANQTGSIGRTGFVGIGTTSPGAQLEVSGLMMLSPVAMPGNCNGDSEGSIYYDEVLKSMCICNGTHWVKLDGSGHCECIDSDGDGFDTCDAGHPYDTDGLPADCDDNDPDTYPGATEYCNGKDNNCDGLVDNGAMDAVIYYRDQDGDGWGNSDIYIYSCFPVDGYVAQGGDCNDSDPEIHPGAEEICDGKDNNCDGFIDEYWPELGEYCTAGLGACMRGGFYVCDPSGLSTMCSAVPGNPEEEFCNHMDMDCDGIIDNGFRDENGIYYNDFACGNCYIDCTTIFDLPNAYGECNTEGQTPVCVMNCNPGFYDLDQMPYNGCEFYLDPNAVYVSADDPVSTDDSGCGLSPFEPCRSITYGITRAVNLGRQGVHVANGLYSETVNMYEGVNLFGGYDNVTWTRNPVNSSTLISGTATLNGHNVTVVAQNINQAELSGFVIFGKDAGTPGANSYAIYANNCGPEFTLKDNTVYAGKGAGGSDGTFGEYGLQGVNGTGRDSDPVGYDPVQSTTTGCNAFINRQHENGGVLIAEGDQISGGSGGGNFCTPVGGTNTSGRDGYFGMTGAGPYDGSAGQGGSAGYDREFDGSICLTFGFPAEGSNGQNGGNGANGNAGNGGSASSTVSGGHWIGGYGIPGQNGGNGGGGGGGGAGGGYDCTGAGCDNRDYLGSHGGGAGSGGGMGHGGGGGSSGGGSFGIFLNGGQSPLITGNVVHLGSAGDGGNGGAGGPGGAGGKGALGGQLSHYCLGTGGNGGDGGNGGNGGGGGGGAGGSAYGIFTFNTSGSMNYELENVLTGGSAGQGGNGGISYGLGGESGQDGALIPCSYN